jgi:thiamine-monophosphate kinase
MTTIPLGPGPEFDRIRAIASVLGDAAAGLGDDCAVMPTGAGDFLVLSTDTSIEGTHFRRAWLTPFEIGWRATAAALSDLAAEGASVVGVLVALSLERGRSGDDPAAIMRGVGECVRGLGGKVLGGDLTAARDLALTVTVVGRATKPVSRAGAQPGDELWVTGTLGGARAALAAFEGHRTPGTAEREAFARPHARIAAGLEFAALGATAMLDLSDGLAGDARHLAAASGVRLEIDLPALPIGPGVASAAGAEPAAVFAAKGGEDYELLAALPAGALQRGAMVGGVPVARIGRVVGGSGVSLVLDGREVDLPGFDHFR